MHCLVALLLIAATSCVPSQVPDSKPSITTPAVATLIAAPLALKGNHFGIPSPGRWLLVRETSGTEVRIPSTDPSILSWLDQRITVRLPSQTTSGSLVIVTPSGQSRSVRLDVYRYDTFAVPERSGANASPLALAIDGGGRVWLNQEFHLDSAPLAMLQPAATALALIDAPAPAGPGPFATRIGGTDKNTHFTELGEDVIVDSKGRVWLSEGGGLLYDGPLPNHSRVVSYDPSAPAGNRFRIYNLPRDHNEIVGLAWDSTRNRLWLAEGGLQTGPKLLSFDPERTPFDNTFDFSRPLDSLLHSVNDTDPTGYRVYPLPTGRGAYPAQLMVESDGSVWFTAYVGNSIGRLDPITGAVTLLPLSKPVSTNTASRAFGTGGPWDIAASPGGGLAFNSQFDNALSRLNPARMSNLASCMKLDRSGRNPCLRTISIPGDLTHELIHSAAFDSAGRLWFTQHAFGAAAGTLVSIGFVDPTWNFVVMLPDLPLLPGDSAGSASNDGIAIDPNGGDIWFAEYFRHRVSRLHHIGATEPAKAK